MSDLINGRTPEKILFNIRERAYGACLSECSYDGSDDCMEELLNDALALIERLESERDAALAKVPKWISVEEQPNPPEDGEYWCHGYWLMSGRKQTEVAEYLGEWKIVNNFILTHWMPLPQPPEGDA